MKAAQYIKAGEIAYQDVPVSPLGDDELRIKVAYCGICGTDLQIFKGHMDARVRAPQAIGHEVSGTVAEVGKNVSDFRINEKVTVRPLDNCGTCNTCRAGFTHICEKLRFLGIELRVLCAILTVPARPGASFAGNVAAEACGSGGAACRCLP